MHRLLLLFVTIGVCYCQNIGGIDGPCSAFPIQAPYNKPLTIFGSTVGASSFSSSSCPTSASTWYTIRPTVAGNITLTTCAASTNFDTIIAVYTGSCVTLTCLTMNDNGVCTTKTTASTVVFTPSVNSTYYVAVYGSENTEGNFEMIISQVSSQPASGCSVAAPVQGPYFNEVTVYGSNVNGFTGFSQCSANTGTFFIWYQIFPEVGIPFQITTCNPASNYDTVLLVLAGSNCSQLTCVVTDDDNCFDYLSSTSTVTFLPTVTSYFVAVGGYLNHTGTYEVSFLQQESDPTSPCNTAPSIQPNTQVSGTTVGAPILEYDACVYSANYSAVWYRIEGFNINSPITVTTCRTGTTLDTTVFVYSGSCGALQCVGFNDDGSCPINDNTSTLTFLPAPETSYYVVVSGFDGAVGEYVLAVHQP